MKALNRARSIGECAVLLPLIQQEQMARERAGGNVWKFVAVLSDVFLQGC
jgi:hypothetical protein